MAQRVTVVDYRPEWPEMYAREAAAIADILGEKFPMTRRGGGRLRRRPG